MFRYAVDIYFVFVVGSDVYVFSDAICCRCVGVGVEFLVVRYFGVGVGFDYSVDVDFGVGVDVGCDIGYYVGVR